MKPLIYLLFALSAWHYSNAQNIKIVPNCEAGLTYTTTANMGNYKYSSGNRLHIGSDIGYQFVKNLGVFTGIGIGNYQNTYINLKDGLRLQNTAVFIEQPLYLRYQTMAARKINFYVQAGFQLAYYISGSYIEHNSVDIENAGKLNTVYKGFEIKPVASAGINISLSQRSGLDIGFFNNIGISNIYKNNFSEYTSQFGGRIALNLALYSKHK